MERILPATLAMPPQTIIGRGAVRRLLRHAAPFGPRGILVHGASLRRTDVLDLADRYANHLSGGELQRVLLARCLAAETNYILLDEPTSNLDLSHTFDVLELCRDLAEEGRALVLAIHDLASALRFADRVVVLSKGNVVASGPTREVLTPERILEVFGVRAERVTTGEGIEGFLFARR